MQRSTNSFAKKAFNLYQSIHQQLSVHAIAVTVVALVTVLALTQPSEAKIVYTPANIGIGANQKYNLDLNHDGVTDFTIQYYSSWTNSCRFFSYLSLQPASSNRVVYAFDGLGEFAAALGRAIPIGRSSGFSFRGQGQTMADFHARVPDCFLAADGPWVNAVDRYLGLSFQKNGHTHYGWAKLNVQLHSFHYRCEFGASCYFIATLTGYAYETIPGKAIITGQTKETADELEEDDFGLKAQDAETLGGKPVADFVLRDPDIPASNAAATSSPGFCYPQNCLIQRCRVGSNNRLTGLCLEGVRGGVCRSGGYDPTHCPPGAKPKSPVSKQCGGLELLVDASRPCL
jgi:hypothetical protein